MKDTYKLHYTGDTVKIKLSVLQTIIKNKDKNIRKIALFNKTKEKEKTEQIMMF